MRVIMLGTGPFAVPMFQSLLDSAHQVLALVTRPTPPAKDRDKEPVQFDSSQQTVQDVSPTLVVIGRDGQAGEIVGFTDKVEIAQRVADGLAATPK